MQVMPQCFALMRSLCLDASADAAMVAMADGELKGMQTSMGDRLRINWEHVGQQMGGTYRSSLEILHQRPMLSYSTQPRGFN